ncbi:MAG: GTPase ObgE [Deltaproteobacteria bacterium]|nr:GTPase ObgE [Deltaproteobacteria bacterium]
MKFVDEAKIYIRSGDGGKGCVSFRREKYVPRGGPDGGDGGKGGDIVAMASKSHRTLLDMKYNQHHFAKRGDHGSGSNKTGKSASDLEIILPVGTIVSDAETGEILADLTEDGQRSILARGGIGGRGNARFATATNRAPRYAQDGIPGEERVINLELKLLADVGITGLPNVGKSTFISRISAAKPKIADYPFTTLKPNLGIVKFGDYGSFAVADIPGLIEGAHRGAGLGIKFLRHIERTSLLLHIIDISKDDYVSGWEDFKTVNNELVSFSSSMIEKPQIVAINKMDLPVTQERIQAERDTFGKEGITIFPISAVTGEGIQALMGEILEKLKTCGVL